KHGVVGLTRALPEELRPDGITVNAVCPGSVDTDMLRTGMPGAKQHTSPDDVASGARHRAGSPPTALTAATAAGEARVVPAAAGVGEVVMAHELPDGRFNLVVRGRARIRIDEELASDRPYRLISATELPDLPPSDPRELLDADQSLRALVGHLADAIPEGGE